MRVVALDKHCNAHRFHLNGPINSGKSSVGRALADLLPGAVVMDRDDHDAPEDASPTAGIQAALRRIETPDKGACERIRKMIFHPAA